MLQFLQLTPDIHQILTIATTGSFNLTAAPVGHVPCVHLVLAVCWQTAKVHQILEINRGSYNFFLCVYSSRLFPKIFALKSRFRRQTTRKYASSLLLRCTRKTPNFWRPFFKSGSSHYRTHGNAWL